MILQLGAISGLASKGLGNICLPSDAVYTVLLGIFFLRPGNEENCKGKTQRAWICASEVNIDKLTGCKPVGWRLRGDLCLSWSSLHFLKWQQPGVTHPSNFSSNQQQCSRQPVFPSSLTVPLLLTTGGEAEASWVAQRQPTG